MGSSALVEITAASGAFSAGAGPQTWSGNAALVEIEEQTRRERDAIRRVREARSARADETKGAR